MILVFAQIPFLERPTQPLRKMHADENITMKMLNLAFQSINLTSDMIDILGQAAGNIYSNILPDPFLNLWVFFILLFKL